MPHVVLDKSYLQGTRRKEIVRLCEEDGVYMTDVLFMELMTTDEESRRRCFSKFPATDNPVYLIPNVGTLFRYEADNKLPCTPLYNRRFQETFRFNPKLATGNFKLTDQQKQTIGELEVEIQKIAQAFKDRATLVIKWFPELEDFPPCGPQERIHAAMVEVARNQEKVSAIYGEIRAQIFSEPKQIDERWAFFRWTQAHLLAALEFVRKNGARRPDVVSIAIEHDRLDIDYVILGALAGALASRDEIIKKLFRLICPDGRLVC